VNDWFGTARTRRHDLVRANSVIRNAQTVGGYLEETSWQRHFKPHEPCTRASRVASGTDSCSRRVSKISTERYNIHSWEFTLHQTPRLQIPSLRATANTIISRELTRSVVSSLLPVAILHHGSRLRSLLLSILSLLALSPPPDRLIHIVEVHYHR
jgi:hypothetical protein